MSKQETSIKYPYSRLKGLSEFMDFAQEPDWKPTKIDTALFKKLGLAKGKEAEAVATLRFLALIDESGTPTADFHQLQEKYRPTMSRLVRKSYSDVFDLIPPRL